MNGYNTAVMMGSVNPAEPVPIVTKRKPSNRIQIRNLSNNVTKDSVEAIVSGFGTIKKCNFVANSEDGTFATVIFDTPEEAQSATDRLNGYLLDGLQLQVEIMNSNPASGRGLNNTGRARQPRNPNSLPSPRGTGIPLRIMVPSEYVGAIIGRKGQTIRNITTRCKARVDVHGKENSGLIEKVISIFGQPENCTNACKEILQVMQQEATVNNRGEVILKMLADDRFCGRIIGKEGKMIKKIREDTGTKITVSNAQEMLALYPDRVIAIRGASIDNISQAEAAISLKLAECIENEVQQGVVPPAMMMPPVMRPMNANGYYNTYENCGYYVGGGPMYGNNMMSPAMGPPVNESLQISVPNAAVGAIIGSAGANIKQIMRESGAFVNIETKKDADPSVDRLVTVKGTPDACWRASYLVFEKLKMEGFAGNDDVRLKTSLRIPKVVVGRLIGKGGKNVRELQRITGAMIKLPEDPSVQGEEVTVEVFGSFLSIQGAHSRIRAMASQSQVGQFNNGGAQRRSAPPESHP
jgi:insulin-like growth factor 2 mRNA-binding protein 1